MTRIGSLFLFIIITASCTHRNHKGCMDLNATNFDPTAKKDDGSCAYPSQILLTIDGVMEYGSIQVTPLTSSIILEIESSIGTLHLATTLNQSATYKANMNPTSINHMFFQTKECFLHENMELQNNSELDVLIQTGNLQGRLDLTYSNNVESHTVEGQFLLPLTSDNPPIINELSFINEQEIVGAIYKSFPTCPKNRIYFLTNLNDTLIIKDTNYSPIGEFVQVGFNNHSYPYQSHALAGNYSVPPSSQCTQVSVNNINYIIPGSTRHYANHLQGNTGELTIYAETERTFQITLSSLLLESGTSTTTPLNLQYTGQILNLPL